MEKTFNNRELKAMIRTAGCGEDMLFYAKDVAWSLGYARPADTVRMHVSEENRHVLRDLKNSDQKYLLIKWQPNTVLINRKGLDQLMSVSLTNKTKDLWGWIHDEVIHTGKVKQVIDKCNISTGIVFSNKNLDVSVRALRINDKVLFYAKDATKSLGYKNASDAIGKHVWEENRVTIGCLPEIANCDTSIYEHNSEVLLYEPGLYQLIFGSRLPTATAFQRWVFNDVLPSIRKAGQYIEPKCGQLCGNQMVLKSEADLHYAVVKYIRKYHPEARIMPGLGEYQRTLEIRRDAWRKGYRGGQPDIVIMNACSGFHGYALELKTPKGNGTLRENQRLLLESLSNDEYKTLVSDDYTEIILDIERYFNKSM